MSTLGGSSSSLNGPSAVNNSSNTAGLGLSSNNSNSSLINQKKKYQSLHTPRRVGSMSSLPTLNESTNAAASLGAPAGSKRPGDYYIQKLSNSSLNLSNKAPIPPNNVLNNHNTNRPTSGDSIISLQSNLSDDLSLVSSSQFDFPDSRLSSLTSNSITSPSVSPSNRCLSSESSVKEPHTPNNQTFNDDVNEDVVNDLDQVNSSHSTITLKNPYQKSINSISPVSNSSTPSVKKINEKPPQLKSMSSPNIVTANNLPKNKSSNRNQSSPRTRSSSMSSTPTLNRSKSRYLNPKEKKERQQLRKKLYDDNDDDDDILSNDLDLVFNVPVIQNNAKLYLNQNNSSKLLSRTDLINDKTDNKYSINENNSNNSNFNSPRPFPLPGKLSRSTGSLDNLSPINNVTGSPMNHYINDENVIAEEDENEDEINDSNNTSKVSSFSFGTDDDLEITQNISNFYNERSTSFSKLVKINREQDVIYKLPNYVKSQSSVEDLQLISPEKLNCLDQSRPINLPPKNVNDKLKHNKEFHKVLTNFELNSRASTESRKKLNEQFMFNQQHWFKLMLLNDKELNKKLSNDKNSIRKLNWDLIIPEKFRFEYFSKILSSTMKEDDLNQINNEFNKTNDTYKNLSTQMKSSKDNEFDRSIETILDRPLFQSIMTEFEENEMVEFSLIKFKSNFKHLLYLKSLSENGLKKHDEIFLIPIFLIMFQNNQSIEEIYKLTEMYNYQVLNSEFFNEINSNLSNWYSSNHSYSISKVLGPFNHEEFENLSSNVFFEIFIQINDKLPLSMSAPSTPILSQPGSFGMGSPMPSLPGSPVIHQMNESAPNSRTSSLASSSNPNSIDGLQDLFTQSHLNSSSLGLVAKFLQLLLIYSHSTKTKLKNNLKICQGFLVVIFKYYHINWNDYGDLIKGNKSIRLNKSMDQTANLDSFVDKWKSVFKKI